MPKDTVNFWTLFKRILRLFWTYSRVGPLNQTCDTGLESDGPSYILDLAAKEEERVWVKRQTDGELDDSRLTDGLTGEATVYKRRGMEKPEFGRPQIKCVG